MISRRVGTVTPKPTIPMKNAHTKHSTATFPTFMFMRTSTFTIPPPAHENKYCVLVGKI